MKQREKENLLSCIILTFIGTLLLCWMCPTQGHEPCACDTCCEYHYQQIRSVNPEFNMPE